MSKQEYNVIPRIDHICLSVKDMRVSCPFYKELYVNFLGGKVIDEDSGFLAIKFEHDFKYFLLELSQEHKEFRDSTFNRYRVGLHHFALEIKNKKAVDQVYRKLLDMKVTILDKPTFYPQYDDGYYAVYFEDPNGFKMEFMTYDMEAYHELNGR